MSAAARAFSAALSRSRLSARYWLGPPWPSGTLAPDASARVAAGSGAVLPMPQHESFLAALVRSAASNSAVIRSYWLPSATSQSVSTIVGVVLVPMQ